jgi:hypothetical protein
MKVSELFNKMEELIEDMPEADLRKNLIDYSKIACPRPNPDLKETLKGANESLMPLIVLFTLLFPITDDPPEMSEMSEIKKDRFTF